METKLIISIIITAGAIAFAAWFFRKKSLAIIIMMIIVAGDIAATWCFLNISVWYKLLITAVLIACTGVCLVFNYIKTPEDSPLNKIDLTGEIENENVSDDLPGPSDVISVNDYFFDIWP